MAGVMHTMYGAPIGPERAGPRIASRTACAVEAPIASKHAGPAATQVARRRARGQGGTHASASCPCFVLFRARRQRDPCSVDDRTFPAVEDETGELEGSGTLCDARDTPCAAGTVCDAASGACVSSCGGCTIGDVCFVDEDVNPNNGCEVCDAHSQVSLSGCQLAAAVGGNGGNGGGGGTGQAGAPGGAARSSTVASCSSSPATAGAAGAGRAQTDRKV